MLFSNDGYRASEVHTALKYNSSHGFKNKWILNITYIQRIITRISLELIFNFVIKVSTGYLKDGFIYINLKESKAGIMIFCDD